MARWRVQKSIGCIALAAALGMAACGGVSERRTGGEGDGKGGTSAAGGTNATGGDGATSGTNATGGVSGVGGTGGGRPCALNGVVYPHGSTFPSEDGCNTCFCDDGGVSCTLIDCPRPARCDEIAEEYPVTLTAAKRCDPNAANPCTAIVSSGIACGCPTIAEYGSSEEALGSLQAEASELGCSRGIVCGACPSDTVLGYCSAEGICKDVFVPNDCDALRETYREAFARADHCDPMASNQCQRLAISELGCSCPTHVNATDELRLASLAWNMLACENDMPCTSCPIAAPDGACLGTGTCMDVELP